MKKILIVEDSEKAFEMMAIQLSDKVAILWAETLKSAEKMFNEDKDVDLIILDACIDGGEMDVLPFLNYVLSSGFSNPVIASSNNNAYREIMIDKGATHGANKHNTPSLALRLLGAGREARRKQ